jgi:hypothetical protein
MPIIAAVEGVYMPRSLRRLQLIQDATFLFSYLRCDGLSVPKKRRENERGSDAILRSLFDCVVEQALFRLLVCCVLAGCHGGPMPLRAKSRGTLVWNLNRKLGSPLSDVCFD